MVGHRIVSESLTGKLMKTYQHHFKITTPGRGLINISLEIADIVSQSNVTTGIANIFLHHTSASLIICENSDPVVQEDFERFMLRLIPDGDPIFKHTAEGLDDMPSHVRTMLTQSFLSIPITKNQLALGIWQGIYLYEHRLKSHHRKITVTTLGV